MSRGEPTYKEIDKALDEYWEVFHDNVGLRNMAVDYSELIRRVKEAIKTGKPIPGDDYTFYAKMEPGQII